MVETVKEPFEIIVSKNEFSATLFTTFLLQNTDVHVFIITNAGAALVTFDTPFSYIGHSKPLQTAPSDERDQPLLGIYLSRLSLGITGGPLTVLGHFRLIAGIVIVVIEINGREEQRAKAQE